MFCLHQRDCVVWKYLLGCSLTAYWRKTAPGLVPKGQKPPEHSSCAIPPTASAKAAVPRYPFEREGALTSVFFSVMLRDYSDTDVLHIWSAMMHCWPSPQLGPVSIKHLVESQVDCDWDSGYRVSVCSSPAIRIVQNYKNKWYFVIQENATGSLSSVLANLF